MEDNKELNEFANKSIWAGLGLAARGVAYALGVSNPVGWAIVGGGVLGTMLLSNSHPGLDRQNARIRELEEERARNERENRRKQEEWEAEKVRIEKTASERHKKELEEKLSQERNENERKQRAEAERWKRENEKALKEKDEEKKRIEKHGWDCKDYPRRPWQSGYVINVAVSGTSGAGKSTLVNRLLDLPKGQRAKIGAIECTDVINEKTCEPPRYKVKNKDGINVLDMFDLPGCNTEKFPAASYIKDFGLRYFHLVIIVTADRITQADIMLKNELDKFRVPCLIVRNKVDLAVKTNLIENDMSKDETLKELRNYFKGKGISNPILISAIDKGYEWKVLVEKYNNSIKRMCGNVEKVDKDPDNTCDCCFAEWIDTTFKDCGHRLICSKCARQNSFKNCPKCGNNIKNIKYD